MSFVEISCPAKTFVLGEYGVLDGGSAILVNTAPRFSCNISKKNKNFHFAKQSPASQWVQTHPEDFKNVSLDWIDPYNGEGGLGFSSAQFNIVYAYSFLCNNLVQSKQIAKILSDSDSEHASQRRTQIDSDSDQALQRRTQIDSDSDQALQRRTQIKKKELKDCEPKDLWNTYRDLSYEGVLPSGADTISQWLGGVCIFKQDPFSVKSVTFPFSDLEFSIFRTGKNLKTHLHLRKLDLPSVEDLKEITYIGLEALKNKQEDLFLKSINEYRHALDHKGLTSDYTLKLLKELSGVKEILALKGCGAMGTDMIIVFYHKESEGLIQKKTSHLVPVAKSSQLTHGLEFRKIK